MHPAERTAHLSSSELTALRRKKNADAQAAFRKRRANYIATLEETVNNLEQVVRSLQETIQESKMTEHDLKSENNRLKFELESLRKAQQNDQATPPRLDSAHWPANGVGFRASGESTSVHHYSTGSVTPSATPPLSTSPSPPASSTVSTSTSTSMSNSYPPSALPSPSVYSPDDGPVNLMCRPAVQRSASEVKPQFSAGAGENMYAFQSRPQDAGGWIDSPVDSQSVVAHGYVVGDQTRSLYSGNVQRFSSEALTPGPLPLSVSIDDQRRRNSASTSPTATDPGSPLAFSPRGPPAMYVASQQQQLQGMDTGAAFRSYFSHATGVVQPPAGPSSTYAASQADDGDMKEDFDDFERGAELPLSDTLAVLKAHAFGGVRKPRTRNSRGRDDRD